MFILSLLLLYDKCGIQKKFMSVANIKVFPPLQHLTVLVDILQIFALKALVQVYCSAINLESIEELFQVLLKFLHRGEQSDDNKSEYPLKFKKKVNNRWYFLEGF
jgi:hypothetical protein